MKDVRFREWDQAREDMMPGHGMSYSVRKDSDDEVSFVFAHYESDESWKDNHRVLEQYTGVDDATGKPIYEGDILQNRKYKSVVKHIGTGFSANVIGYQNIYPFYGRDETVIGNIHENPELLEVD